MKNFYKKTLMALMIGMSHTAMSQTAPVIVEAESGTRSPDTLLEVKTEDEVTFIAVTQDLDTNTSAPGTASRVSTYTVTFPAAGTYDLYIRHRVGSTQGGAADDSFYYGRGFGVKDVAVANNWVRVNNNNSKGFVEPEDVVTEGGTATTQVWKWLNITKFSGHEAGVAFTVPAGELTQTFQWGSRENGLDVDKFAFGLQGEQYTVAAFNASVVTSLKKVKEYTFDVYPNPVTRGKLAVNSMEKINSLKVIDSKGEVIKEFKNLNQFSSEFELNVKPGLYFIQVNNGQNHSSRKIIVN